MYKALTTDDNTVTILFLCSFRLGQQWQDKINRHQCHNITSRTDDKFPSYPCCSSVAVRWWLSRLFCFHPKSCSMLQQGFRWLWCTGKSTKLFIFLDISSPAEEGWGSEGRGTHFIHVCGGFASRFKPLPFHRLTFIEMVHVPSFIFLEQK